MHERLPGQVDGGKTKGMHSHDPSQTHLALERQRRVHRLSESSFPVDGHLFQSYGYAEHPRYNDLPQPNVRGGIQLKI